MNDLSNMHFRALGHPSAEPSRTLETFPCPANVTVVRFTSEELTAFCPVTHQPDFYEFELEFRPHKLCIESKSLKLFLWSYREERCFAEQLAGAIAQQVVDAIAPKYCKVSLRQQVRGGLQLTAVAEIGGE